MNARSSTRRKVLNAGAAAALLNACGPIAWAQTSYPERPIRLIVPTGPGGGADTFGRLFAQKMGDSMGQPVYVENIGGAGGLVGADRVAKAKADGYTLLYGINPIATIIPYLVDKMPYQPEDIRPVSLTNKVAYIWLANKALPANNIKELIALAKSDPTKVSFASTGIGSAAHLGGEMLMREAGIEMLHVPFKGTGLIELMAGQVSLKMEPAGSAVALVKSGKLKALAVTSATRLSALPDVPAVAEVVPGYEIMGWQGVWVPRDTPPAIVAKLQSEIVKAVRSADMQQRLAEIAAEPVGSTPAQMQALIDQEARGWKKIIQERKITADPSR